MHLGPRWPSRISVAKSICMRVTSGGSIAAPGPTLMLSNWDTKLISGVYCLVPNGGVNLLIGKVSKSHSGNLKATY